MILRSLILDLRFLEHHYQDNLVVLNVHKMASKETPAQIYELKNATLPHFRGTKKIATADLQHVDAKPFLKVAQEEHALRVVVLVLQEAKTLLAEKDVRLGISKQVVIVIAMNLHHLGVKSVNHKDVADLKLVLREAKDLNAVHFRSVAHDSLTVSR